MGDALLSIPGQFNVAEYFVDRNVREGRGDSLAILCHEQALTYGQVLERVNRAASAFARAGLQTGERVLVLLDDSPAFAEAFWGAIKAGAIPIPSNTLLSAEEYEFKLRDSGARSLVVQDRLLERVAPALRRLPDLKIVWVAGEAPPDLGSFERELAQSSPRVSAAPTRRDAPAFWLYTSGSTGRPKAAVHRHQDMLCCLEFYAKQVLGISARDRTFSTSKLFFAYGLGNALYFPMGVGASTVLLPEKPTAEKILQVLGRYQPTVFYSVPTLYAAMLEAREGDREAFRSVRCAVSAGEALPAPLWERFRARYGLSIVDGIGSTEMLHMFISNRPEDIVPGSSGKPVPGYEARIVDELGGEVAPGQMGELRIRGGSAAAGYWNRPELTRATFRGDWTLTGDRYIRDERGNYWYCGRGDDMMKVSGMWVSPLEVETALLAHPAVLECAVVGVTDSDGLVKPKAFVVIKDARTASAHLEAELFEFLRQRMSGYKVPRWIVFTAGLPRTATGKVQRFKLREISSARRPP